MKRLVVAAFIFGSLATYAAIAQVTGPASVGGIPAGAQPFALSATGTTSATLTITQPAAYQRTYVTSITMTEAGGTAVSANGSITNTVSGPISFAQLGQLAVNVWPPLVNNGSNMVLTTPTATAATASAVTATGYFY